MATKKSILVFFGILVISAWVLGSAIQAGAETLNYKIYTYGIKQEMVPIGDVEGHALGFDVRRGFYVFENGEVAIVNQAATSETVKGGYSVLLYSTVTFPDGSTIMTRSQGTLGGGVPGVPCNGRMEKRNHQGNRPIRRNQRNCILQNQVYPSRKRGTWTKGGWGRNLHVHPAFKVILRLELKAGEKPRLNGLGFLLERKKVNYENIRCIGSKHCIGEYFVLSYGDGCPFHAS